MTASAAHRAPDMVWYAGYGSNLCAARFLCYIEGGTQAGLTRRCGGARDKTHPRADRALDIPHRLYFAGHAPGWGGSPCFVDTVETQDTRTHARAYLITWGQFEDVVAQENGRATTPVDLDLVDLAPGRSFLVGPGRYENVLCVGRFDELPVVSFTSPGTISQAELGAPSPAYLQTMIAGLRESRAMSDDAVVAYLGAAPGCSEALVVGALGPHRES